MLKLLVCPWSWPSTRSADPATRVNNWLKLATCLLSPSRMQRGFETLPALVLCARVCLTCTGVLQRITFYKAADPSLPACLPQKKL